MRGDCCPLHAYARPAHSWSWASGSGGWAREALGAAGYGWPLATLKRRERRLVMVFWVVLEVMVGDYGGGVGIGESGRWRK